MRTIKSVAFNVADPYELKLINHLHNYPNFSGYVKRLIQRDMEGGKSTDISIEVENEVEDNTDLMRKMI